MNAEQQYLIDLVHAWAGGRTTPLPLPNLVSPGAIRDRLRAHNVEAVLAALLPAEVLSPELVQQVNISRSRTEFLLLEYERLLPVLTAQDCQPVLLKGGALALGTYPDPAARWFLDLDVLVPRPEVDRVCARLQAAGYRYLRGKRDPLFYNKYHLHRMMIGPQGSVVEVHWALTLPGSVYQHDVAGVFTRAETWGLGCREAACAAPVDQILHGVYQNIADGFVDLRRVLDLVLLARRLESADWQYLVDQARETGMAKALFLSLHNMKYVSGESVPGEVMAALDPGNSLRRTLHGVSVAAGCLDRKAQFCEGYVPMLHFLLTPSKRLQMREILRSLWVGEALLLDQGHRPDRMPGVARRTLIGLRQFKTLMFVSWQASCAFVRG